VTAFITGDVLAPGAYEISLTRATGGTNTDVGEYEVAIRP
jgi:hypothetical protein